MSKRPSTYPGEQADIDTQHDLDDSGYKSGVGTGKPPKANLDTNGYKARPEGADTKAAKDAQDAKRE